MSARRLRGHPARAAAVAGAVALFLMLKLIGGPWPAADFFFMGFADGAVVITTPSWTVLSSPIAQALAAFAGAFLSLWLVLPVTAELRVGAVLLRSLVAGAMAMTGVLILGALAWGFGPFGWLAEFALEIVATREQFEGSPLNPWNRLREAVDRLLDLLPTALLGGVLLWLWERNSSRTAVV
ncbi:hypothetical protein ACFFGH_10895 [Lysobacter korlensis]|uniref:Uncharacterized protein n=1 Tax=Lysobacter korlensis TaxID=553636 RepID=A0ABV6RNH0_9GAMM